MEDPNVLVGTSTLDDAGVYRINEELALVQTVDVFPPVVDDPYYYGAIAAANSLSDVYAMGGRPLSALNVVCFPAYTAPLETLGEILRGGSDKAAEAGVAIIGGHTLDDPEPKYGLAVTGVVHPDKIITNAGAQVGDELILTKPLGMGIMTTALKAGLLSEDHVREIMEIMATLNKAAAEAMMEIGVNACTDITGFGLLGHLHEMALASRVGARVYLDWVPVVPETWKLVRQDIVPGGTRRNLSWLSHAVLWDPQISGEAQLVLCDAQTSGGLLMAVPRGRTERMMEALTSARVTCATKIGEIIAGEAGQIQVLPSE